MRKKIIIQGVVQGVGFRPFIYQLAQEHDINGWVNNSAVGVVIEAEGEKRNLKKFESDISLKKPTLSVIMSYESSELDDIGYSDFKIIESIKDQKASVLILPDTSTCNECRDEILNPSNRRYYYPFTNCTNCGPRYSIIQSLPYDRHGTTMKNFTFCHDCKKEYKSPSNRRFHAQPNACTNCGPFIELIDNDGNSILSAKQTDSRIVIEKSAFLLKEGKIIALKGLGGFQLLVDASNDAVIQELRKRKNRERKPFALMFRKIVDLEEMVFLSEIEKEILTSNASPIVLLKKKKDKKSNRKISYFVSFDNPYIGVMLPYTPLHILLMEEFQNPIVATSGNLSSEPICIDNKEALESLKDIADYFLLHNRPIERAVDDSVIRFMKNRPMILRRARGYAPLPLVLPEIKYEILGVGAQLKNTIALSRSDHVFLSQHIGDLENEKTYTAFVKTIEDMIHLLEINPKLIVGDKHPNYLSRSFAEKYSKDHEIPFIDLQHHYAHILSVLAENEVLLNDGEKVLGIAWDGTGYGDDGILWGSEFMIADWKSYARKASLKSIALPGGEKAIREPWRILFSIFFDMSHNFSEWEKKVNLWQNFYRVEQLNASGKKLFYSILEKEINTPRATGMGRLFDAVSALLGFTRPVSFEGEAAMELEFLAASEVNSLKKRINQERDYIFQIQNTEINYYEIIEKVLNELSSMNRSKVALKFHHALVYLILGYAQQSGLSKVALSGGVFQNIILLENTVRLLKKNGFSPYWHQKVPPNDAGIALGQIIHGNQYLKNLR